MVDREWIENEQRFQKNKERRENNLDKYAKSNLKRIIKISIETAAIGSLSDFEDAFGNLWGHGKSYNELTDKEKDMRDQWLDIRASILDRAANGVKISLRSVDRCEIKSYEDRKFNTIIRNRNDESGRR